MYEKNLDELDMMKMNLETQIHTLESAKMNVRFSILCRAAFVDRLLHVGLVLVHGSSALNPSSCTHAHTQVEVFRLAFVDAVVTRDIRKLCKAMIFRTPLAAN